MFALPASIEQSLRKRGVSEIEIVVLRHLFQAGEISIEEIAKRTHKRPNIVRRAVIALLKKEIIEEYSNPSPRYSLQSLESVMGWLFANGSQKDEALSQDYRNFSSYIARATRPLAHPNLSRFEGIEELKTAYEKLLTFCDKELWSFLPVEQMESDIALKDLHARHARICQEHNIFQRIIVHDTAAGKRYQSHDAPEFRQTVLVPAECCLISFERIIANDIVACFDLQECRACFIHFSEFACGERISFSSLFNKYTKSARLADSCKKFKLG